MRIEELAEQACPVTRAIATVGDVWTLVILRELLLGATRFDEIQLTSGISPLLLTRRLRELEAVGIIERRQYSGRRYDHLLTPKGQDLFGVLLAMKSWHERWHEWVGEKTVTVVHSECGKKVGTVAACSCCGRPVTGNNGRFVLSAGANRERLRRLGVEPTQVAPPTTRSRARPRKSGRASPR